MTGDRPGDAELQGWIDRTRAHPGTARQVKVCGCDIAYRIWDAPDPMAPRRDVVLLHGRNASLHWWAPIVPAMASSGRVVALDSSGAGSSGWRDRYSIGLYVHEVLEVVADAGLSDPVLMAHSFGGHIAFQSVLAQSRMFSGLVILDTRLARLTGEIEAQIPIDARPRRHYPDRETILSRFRFLPEQPPSTGPYRDHLAEEAIIHTPKGWTWKFHGLGVDMIDMEGLRAPLPLAQVIAGMTGPLGFIHGLDSVIIRDADLEQAAALSPRMQVLGIAGAGHHIMVDQPSALSQALNGLLLAGTNSAAE
ncbi:alpha/beta fold hydrolase [Frigidibacter albus]|uniref:Alpha/beta fold hydrolase n=1 Tax=Frigidibacter albus TaxID=1465486 RepID=A0A6L8VMS8_9RHOB|nr:alpha/beta hydrolase [Frigidibacter albus]MZQ91096.1 alpha/beta fold hydrolase [Frigidibacter albus]NBE32981.1 alpha/beta fold hydrolase [Frigidibacter albus]GGH62766.1 alpha/beta hydrolase [Frigidibacter albus]